ncbi:DegV family EDD domain-containing protein [Wenzhouxiangella sp. AB-CW3]|uniref:DegV family protein n=1 Tax=Wenzhouxiangella sp. AB-CW3 TaxID=2771012 RepID=UPI00168A6EB7|nr:DegV family protein [Wenzhouxiangella sp. AB-CW3]QOC22907.1 DegV family EDD domain-containing protein [Wenzhouxiangella sp. AB-CW3]
MTRVISHIDAARFEQALLAGIANVFRRRDHINAINVFPVADSDTGTNLAFTLASVRKVLLDRDHRSLPELLSQIADAALDGARGNSGAIMAQYFQGLSDCSRDFQVLDSNRFARVSTAGARSAWSAMAEPVPGTLPTVLEDFADELNRLAADGVDDIREMFRQGLMRAHRSLAATPEQLAVLKDAGVVDAGAQGFVDLLDGVWRYMRSGQIPEVPESEHREGMQPVAAAGSHGAPEQHRFCTECLIEGDGIDVDRLRKQLMEQDADSLVVAGGHRRARVHIHTDRPGEVFRVCGEFGEIRQQKADDMTRQHGLMNHSGQVAIVTDSAADLPEEEIDRLGIHVVPVRLSFGDEEFLDKLTMSPAEFYKRLAESDTHPRTSQPPPADFRRQFELLTSHGLDVLGVQLSRRLSGTLQAAESAAERVDPARVEIVDTRNAACGQALAVLWAAEAAERGWERIAIRTRLEETIGQFKTFALARDLSWGVRGGRIKPWMEKLARRLGLNPVLSATADGRLGARGVIAGRGRAVERFGRYLIKRMEARKTYRMIISHTNAESDARQLRQQILAARPQVDACWIVEASPAVGAHAGPGTLIVGMHPWHPPERRNA